jgi:SM-20-related protein
MSSANPFTPDATFFSRMGLFVNEGFFDPDLCSKIRSEMQLSRSASATVVSKEAPDVTVDQHERKTKLADVSTPTIALVKERLLALTPMLERHYNLTLSGLQEPQFLVYEEGDFFLAHFDTSTDPGVPEFIRERQVSAVMFLNSESEVPGPDVYGGGALTFYGLMNDPRTEEYGFPLTGETGLLIAFPPGMRHEVSPVTHGERYTIVSWFL